MIKRLLENPVVAQLGGLALASTVRGLMSTLDYKTTYYDESVDPALNDLSAQRYVYVFWHEYIPYQLYLRGNCEVSILLSKNRDANFLTHASHHLGFTVIRGSTFSGPTRAVRGMMRAADLGHLAVTPDGPRGPRRRFAAGAIYMASRLNLPLVLIGVGYDRPWRASSWDRFAVPRPWSRARCVVSPPIEIPPAADRATLGEYRLRCERLLTRLTTEAEQWAASGQRCTSERPTKKLPRRRPQTSGVKLSHRAALGTLPGKTGHRAA